MRKGLNTELFPTVNGFCQMAMTAISPVEASAFLGDLSRQGQPSASLFMESGSCLAGWRPRTRSAYPSHMRSSEIIGACL